MTKTQRMAAGVATGFALAFAATAQEVKTQPIEARGLSFSVPETWKKLPPTGQMRALEMKVEPSEGDQDPAEFVLFAFPGGAGTVQQNLVRWQGQFQDESGNPPEIKTEKVEGQGIEVTLVETGGRYVAPIRPGQPERYDKPGYRMLVAVATTDTTGYFIKLVGPEKTIKDAREAFVAMAKSMKVGG